MRKAKDFRDQTAEEVEVAYSDTRKELFHLVNEMKRTKKMEKPHLLREKKKEIARMLTVLTEKQLANQ
jgi:large subunit ribosomal protein L29